MRPYPPRASVKPALPLTAIERGATLFDPSAAISLLWLRRSLKFTIVLLEHLAKAKQEADDRRAVEAVVELCPDLDEAEGVGMLGAGEQLTLYMLHITCFHMWCTLG